jgi:hypothetical protein
MWCSLCSYSNFSDLAIWFAIEKLKPVLFSVYTVPNKDRFHQSGNGIVVCLIFIVSFEIQVEYIQIDNKILSRPPHQMVNWQSTSTENNICVEALDRRMNCKYVLTCCRSFSWNSLLHQDTYMLQAWYVALTEIYLSAIWHLAHLFNTIIITLYITMYYNHSNPLYFSQVMYFKPGIICVPFMLLKQSE